MYNIYMMLEGHELSEDDEGFVKLGEIADALARGEQEIIIQTQYLSFYLGYKNGNPDEGIAGCPNLGKGLYYIKHPFNFHGDRIHKGNVATFIKRVRRHFSRFD